MDKEHLEKGWISKMPDRTFPDDPFDNIYFKGLNIKGKVYGDIRASGYNFPKHRAYKLKKSDLDNLQYPYIDKVVLDVAMIGLGGNKVASMHNEARGYSDISLPFADVGLVLLSKDETLAFKIYEEDGGDNPCSSVNNLNFADYVIRTDELKRFYEEIAGKNKPLDTRERNSYLRLIYAFCKANNIDLAEKGVSQRLELLTQKSGTAISIKTADKIVKQLNEITP